MEEDQTALEMEEGAKLVVASGFFSLGNGGTWDLLPFVISRCFHGLQRLVALLPAFQSPQT